MAPEYVVHGHLTEKADVFSYGVLVLEIITGKRCSGSIGSHGGQALLTKVLLRSLIPCLSYFYSRKKGSSMKVNSWLCSIRHHYYVCMAKTDWVKAQRFIQKFLSYLTCIITLCLKQKQTPSCRLTICLMQVTCLH